MKSTQQDNLAFFRGLPTALLLSALIAYAAYKLGGAIVAIVKGAL